MHPHRGFLLIKCLPCLIRVIVFMHALEVPLLTAADKALGVAFEPVPAFADILSSSSAVIDLSWAAWEIRFSMLENWLTISLVAGSMS